MSRINISESERNRIVSNLNKNFNINLDNVVITDWLSPDEKYVVFLDELYDLENKKNLGDIWKNTDNLILFLEHSFRVSKLRKEIKEHASNTFNKILITEDTKDLSHLKSDIKNYLLEYDLSDFGSDVWSGIKKTGEYAGKFIKDTAKETKKGVVDFGKDLVKGAGKFGGAILSGDWTEVMNLAKQGIKWLARKIRSAVYSPGGIIIDTILIATEVGKVPQVVVWAIVVSLDIYEFVTGDYEDKDENIIIRILFFLIDILGLVTAGIVAKSARATLQGAIRAGGGGIKGLERAAAKNPTVRELLKKMVLSLKELPSKLASVGSLLSKGKFGSLFKMALDKAASFVKWIIENLKSSWKSGALWQILKTTGIVTGIGAGVEYLKDRQEKNIKKAEKDQEKEQEKEQELIGKALSDQNIDYSEYL